MLHNIIKQILNRKKSNAWIALELMLVFCFLWYMVDYFFVLTYNHSIPSYRNYKNTYWVKLSQLPELHPEYNPDGNGSTTFTDNFFRARNRIRQYPNVETIGVSFYGSIPGSGSSRTSTLQSLEDSTRISHGQILTIANEEDFLKVFRHTTDKGRKPVSLKDYDWSDPSAIIITRMMEEVLFPGSSAVGKGVKDYNGDRLTIIGVVDDVKRFSSDRPTPVYFIPRKITEENVKDADIFIRTSERCSLSDFVPQFRRDLSSELRIGNFYLKNITSIEKLEQDTLMDFGEIAEIRIRVGLMLFFMLNILLCVIGTFWYRVNARREEIGIRRAMGATRRSIFNRLNLEGICLLILITLPAMLIEAQFLYAGVINTYTLGSDGLASYLPNRVVLRFIITNLITWLIMAAIVLAGIWFPARAASRLAPVDALRND